MMARVIQGRFLRVGQRLPAVQRQPRSSPPKAEAAGAFRVDEGVLRPHGPGRKLPDPVRAGMEAAFGADFSTVRIHVGPQAQSIGALAFTSGNDIFFAPGQYSPDSAPGRHLIGHELAHVVQQRQGRVRSPFSGGVAVVQDQALEAEADRMGAQAAARLQAAGAKPADCGCGGPPPANHWSLQRKGIVQRMELENSIAYNKPVRSSVAKQSLKHDYSTRGTDKFRLALGGDEKSWKREITCKQGSKPRAPNWHYTMWDSTSNSRPGWTNGVNQQNYYGNPCPGYGHRTGNCANLTTVIDHILPWKFYITNNGTVLTAASTSRMSAAIGAGDASFRRPWSRR